MINRIVIHCSDSPRGRGDTAETIHRWHLERGWSGIGYHYVILEDGEIEAGRPHYWTGSHVKGHNTGSIGICLIGDSEPTQGQGGSLASLLRNLKAQYPGASICGHYQLDPGKTCPNFDVPQWLHGMGFE